MGGLYRRTPATANLLYCGAPNNRRPTAPPLAPKRSCAHAQALDAAAQLADNEAGSLFAGPGEVEVAGRTGPNINDFRAIVVDPDDRIVPSGR